MFEFMKPGDMIYWIYEKSGQPVEPQTELWSSTCEDTVPVDNPAILISITDDEYSWINKRGYFTALRNDTLADGPDRDWEPVVPRSIDHIA